MSNIIYKSEPDQQEQTPLQKWFKQISNGRGKFLFIHGHPSETIHRAQNITNAIQDRFSWGYDNPVDVTVMTGDSFNIYADPLIFDRDDASGAMARDWYGKICFDDFLVWFKDIPLEQKAIRGLSTIIRSRTKAYRPSIMTSEHSWNLWVDVFCDTSSHVEDNEMPLSVGKTREQLDAHREKEFKEMKVLHL